MGGDVGWHLPITAWGHLPASLGRAKHDCLITGSALGSYVAHLFERVPKVVPMSALPWALCVVLVPLSHATLVSLVASFELITMTQDQLFHTYGQK
jgi:hypothetical protein